MKHGSKIITLAIVVFTGLGQCMLKWPEYISYGSETLKEDAKTDSIYIEAKKMIKTAYRFWSLNDMIKARQFIERGMKIRDDYLIRYYMGLVDYRISVYYLQQPDGKKQAGEYLGDGINNLEVSINQDPDFSESYILLSNLLGLKISLNPITGPVLGIRSSNLLKKAEKLDPTNPRLFLVEGVSLINTPGVFGGSEKKAVQILKESIKLFESEKRIAPTMPDWGHDEAYGWLIRSYIGQDSLSEAQQYIDRALTADPDNSWVRYQLQPLLEKKRSAKK